MIPGQPQGFAQSPFTEAYSAELYWESRTIRTSTARALEALRQGGSVWIKGPRGSGRQAFIRHLSAKAATLQLPVALIDSPPPADGEAFIEALLRRLGDEPVPSTQSEKYEALYAALLDGLWRGGALLAFATPEPLTGGALDEAQILVGLKVLEQPLVSIVGCGEGGAPLDGMMTIELCPYTDEELSRLLNHRLVVTGNTGLLEPDEVQELLGGATGPADLLELGSLALGRRLYKKSGEETGTVGSAGIDGGQKAARDIFSPEDVALVSKLLKEL